LNEKQKEVAWMRTLKEIREILAQNKERIREKYGVLILGLFGSYARGEENIKEELINV